MSKVFELPEVRNRAPRNGFDLSQRHLFTASCGQLIPMMSEMCVPSDHFKIDPSIFTRTVTMQRANFARFKEYVDFFFVPLRSIWRYSDDFLVDIENDKSAFSIGFNANNIKFHSAPCVNYKNLLDKYNEFFDVLTTDELGFNWKRGANKLMDMLGFGTQFFYTYGEDTDNLRALDATSVGYINLWRVASYQAIYQHFYRNSHWEDSNPGSFNFDYLRSGVNTISANSIDEYLSSSWADFVFGLFSMRYADYPKDMFTGLMPSTQYGDVSLVSSVIENAKILGLSGSPVENGPVYSLNGEAWNKSSSSVAGAEKLAIQSQISVLDLRRAEALQRWKEIHMVAKKSYKDQIQRTYGYSVPDAYDDVVQYLGGFTNLVNVQDVTATAGTASDSLGDLAGKGIGASQGNTIDFEAKYHGVFMAIYHVEPVPEYSANMLDKQNSIVSFEDYYNPLFGNIGLEGVRRQQLTRVLGLPDRPLTGVLNSKLGYTSRYIEYKTAFDKAHGRFADKGDLANWTLTLNIFKRLNQIIVSDTNPESSNVFVDYNLDYRSFKAKPSDTDGVFVGQQENPEIDNDDTDPFYIVANFDIKAVRPMDVDGMPY